MLLQLQELSAALTVATQLFPFLQQIVASIEGIAPHAPGPTKLDAALAITQNALTTAGHDVATVTQVAAIAPSMIGLAKAQYNATLTAATAAAQPAPADAT